MLLPWEFRTRNDVIFNLCTKKKKVCVFEHGHHYSQCYRFNKWIYLYVYWIHWSKTNTCIYSINSFKGKMAILFTVHAVSSHADLISPAELSDEETVLSSWVQKLQWVFFVLSWSEVINLDSQPVICSKRFRQLVWFSTFIFHIFFFTKASPLSFRNCKTSQLA